MRALILLATVTVLAATSALAQKSLRTIAAPLPTGPSIDKAMHRVLTVTYPAIGQGRMTLSTPAGSFICTPPGAFAVGLPSFTCKATVKRLPLVLEASWLAQNGPNAQTGDGKPIAGQQWGGDCVGTTGKTCTLDMSSDRTVTINPYLKDTAQ